MITTALVLRFGSVFLSRLALYVLFRALPFSSSFDCREWLVQLGSSPKLGSHFCAPLCRETLILEGACPRENWQVEATTVY